MRVDPPHAPVSKARAWLRAALLCAALLLVPAVTWLATPRVGGFVTPPAEPGATHAVVAAPPEPATSGPIGPARGQPLAVRPASDRAVTGIVLDPDGHPLGGAAVSCLDRETNPGSTYFDGLFELAPEADGCAAVAQHPDFVASERTLLSAGNRNTLRVGSFGRIEGVVVDETGAPVAHYAIGIESFVAADAGVPPVPHRANQTIDDPSGAFALGHLAPGRYVLTASARGRPPAHSDGIDVELGRTTSHVRVLLPAGALLTGKVTDAETRRPLAGATVALDGLSATGGNAMGSAQSGEDGSYTLPGVPAGPFSISVVRTGFRTKIVPGLVTRGAPSLTQDVDLSPRTDGGADSEMAGIGATLLPSPRGGVLLGQLMPGSPSEKAGLQSGDQVLRIDGADALAFTVSDCVQRLRGAEGSRVQIRLEREGKPIDVTVTRGLIVR